MRRLLNAKIFTFGVKLSAPEAAELMPAKKSENLLPAHHAPVLE